MIVYLDTSAAFKLLAAEAESEPLAAALTALDPADVLLSSNAEPPRGTIRATGSPRLVTVRLSPAATRRSTSALSLRSSRCEMVAM